MEEIFGQHGWKEFQRNRKNIINEYQKLIDITSNRPIQVAHGAGVEAYLRKWLSEFLPKKYGVTSGYIIPNLYENNEKIYHFDIIIYNQLESPILWTEGNEDNSEQGKFRAIPARNVAAVIEVKSRLIKKNVLDALEKLDQTNKFKEQLPKNYFSQIIFIELKEENNRSEEIIKSLHKGKDVYGFCGGLVLRYEGDETAVGHITIHPLEIDQSNQKTHHSPLAKRIEDLNIFLTEDGNMKIAERGGGVLLVATSKNEWSASISYTAMYNLDGFSVSLRWSRSNFSVFCVDLLSRLEGLSYDESRKISFGMVFDSIRRQAAQIQTMEKRPNYPFIELALDTGGPDGVRHLVTVNDRSATIDFWLEAKNTGDAEAEISDDGFTNRRLLPVGKTAKRHVQVTLTPKNDTESITELIDAEGLEIPYRLVYKTTTGEIDFFSIEAIVTVEFNNISLTTKPQLN